MPKKRDSSLMAIQRATEDLSPPTYIVEEDEQGNLVNKVLKVRFPERPARGKYSLAHFMRNRTEALGCSVSPPTYRVEENEKGELVNKDLQVTYPEYPKQGHYSFLDTLKTKQAAAEKTRNRKLKKKNRRGRRIIQQDHDSNSTDDDDDSKEDGGQRSSGSPSNSGRSSVGQKNGGHHGGCKCSCKECCCNVTNRGMERSEEATSCDSIPTIRANNSSVRMMDSVTQFRRSSVPIPPSLSGVFVGARTPSEIGQMLAKTQFLLYYRRPEVIESIDDVPLRESMYIAYKANNSKVGHYKVRYYSTPTGERMWTVDLGSKAKDQPSFFSLDKLIQYYRVFAVSLDDGCVEFFHK